MHLRKLDLKDAPLMLEWMHDDSVVHDLHTDFKSKKLADAESFIVVSQNESEHINLAIASDTDEYMGTVSLKFIDREAGNAEFAITVRKEAMGRGYSWFGMEAIINKAFNQIGLKSIYWCVSRKNVRAIRFYDKHDFCEALEIPDKILNRYNDVDDLKWYAVYK